MAREDELKKESTLNKILELQKNSSRDIAGRHMLNYEPNKRGKEG